MRKVCILMFLILFGVLIMIMTSNMNIYFTDILMFIFLTCIVNRIFFYIGKYIKLRRERDEFDLIIRKIEERLNVRKISSEQLRTDSCK